MKTTSQDFHIASPKDWRPFVVTENGKLPPQPRAVVSREGVADRLRAAAFAEVQARDAFLWAADRFTDAPSDLRQAWRTLAIEEDKHLGWLLIRLEALGFAVDERPVSDRLWHSFQSCSTAYEFASYMASAETRGQAAGEKFFRDMNATDPVSAKIFAQIALEEKAHVELAARYLPVLPNPPVPRADVDNPVTS